MSIAAVVRFFVDESTKLNCYCRHSGFLFAGVMDM